jgi:sugar phosphate isomerase/epimerase
MLMTRSTRRLTRIGIQIYSLREAAKRDLERTLAEIAAIGYSDVEMLASFNNFGMPSSRLREVLDRNGLRAPSTHIAAEALDDLESTLDEAKILGHEYIVVASLPTAKERTLDDYRWWADRLNEAGHRARERGVWVGFHNHAEDLTAIDGVVPYDVLIQRTDPTVVRHQLDAGNIALAGGDPNGYLQRYGERISLIHLKDVARGETPSDTELGKGVVDFPRLLANVDDIDNKLLFVEQESSLTPLESARQAYSYMMTMDF